MNYPSVYLFSVENEYCGRIVAIVAMSEEKAIEEVKDEYSVCSIKLLKPISVENVGTLKEIYRFDR